MAVPNWAIPSLALELGDDSQEPATVDSGIEGTAPSGTGTISVTRPGGSSTSGGGGGGPGITSSAGYNCTWYRLDAADQPILSQPYDPPPPDGTRAWLRCTGPKPIDDIRTRART